MIISIENKMYSHILITNISNAVRKRKSDLQIPLPSVTMDGRKHFHKVRVKTAKYHVHYIVLNI